MVRKPASAAALSCNTAVLGILCEPMSILSRRNSPVSVLNLLGPDADARRTVVKLGGRVFTWPELASSDDLSWPDALNMQLDAMSKMETSILNVSKSP